MTDSPTDCLAGAKEGEFADPADAPLRYLAAHPLGRSPPLGGLVAALCRKEPAS